MQLFARGGSSLLRAIAATALAAGLWTGLAPSVAEGQSLSFDLPAGMVQIGSRLWVTNALGDSVSIVDVATGKIIRNLTTGYGLNHPLDILYYRGRVWISNRDSLSEISVRTESLIAIRGGLKFPGPIQLEDGRIWTLFDLNKVAELDASNGRCLRVLGGPAYRFAEPSSMAIDAHYLWVGSYQANRVTQISLATGRPVRFVSTGKSPEDNPQSLASDGQHLWIPNADGNFVGEYSEASGELIRRVTSNGQILEPWYVTCTPTLVWVTNLAGPAIDVVAIDERAGRIRAVLQDPVGAPDFVYSQSGLIWIEQLGSGINQIVEARATDGHIIRILS